MSNWLFDLPSSVRVVSYFGPRDQVMSRMAEVMQTGQALYLACHESVADQQALHNRLGVSSLSELDEAAVLIIDECDVLDPQELACLVNTLIQATRSVQLVLFARRPLVDLYADEVIAPLYQCYLGDALIESPYKETHDAVVLYVEAFGQGRVFANGRLIQNWNGPLQIETFFVMLDLMPASTDTLLMALFSSTSEEVYSRFHVSKTYINRILGQDFATLGRGAQSRQQEYYLASDIVLYSDMHDFGSFIKQMFDRNSTQDTILASAVALMQFPYQEYVGQSTNAHIKGRRLQVRYYLSQALSHIGYHVWQQGDTVQAEALFARATVIDRANREPVDALATLYRQQGDTQAAAAVYRRWKDAQQAVAV